MELGLRPQVPPREIIVIDDGEDGDDDDLLASTFDGNEFLNHWPDFFDTDPLDLGERKGQFDETNRNRLPSADTRSRTYIEIDDDDPLPQVDTVITQKAAHTDQTPHGAPPTSVSPDSPEILYQRCRERVLEVFPDVSLDFLRHLYDARTLDDPSPNPVSSIDGIIWRTILEISDLKEYPKQKDKKKTGLKRKRGDGLDDGRNSDSEWAEPGRKYQSVGEQLEAHRLLSLNFVKIPSQFITHQLEKCGNLYSAYWALMEAERKNQDTTSPAFRPLKKPRKPPVPTDNGFPKLQAELEAARERSRKDEAAKTRMKAEAEAEAAMEKKAFEDGDIIECQCCFTDVPTARTTHCDGDTPHFFCFDCASSNAKAQMDLSRYKLRCMDSSGCSAGFARFEKGRFLDDSILARLDRLQQQDELREANLPDLEHCPFCDYAAICPPVEVDREFRCLAPDCELISCRSCKQNSHIPKSCEEHRKEQGIEERHIVEEEMTKALIRRCPRKNCGIPIIKADGCNKIQCTQCKCYICDVCGKDITKEGYNHFLGGSGKGMCPQSDDTVGRENKRIEEAAKLAKEKIRAEHPDISEDDLEVKFSSQVKAAVTAQDPHRRYMHPGLARPLAPPARPAQGPDHVHQAANEQRDARWQERLNAQHDLNLMRQLEQNRPPLVHAAHPFWHAPLRALPPERMLIPQQYQPAPVDFGYQGPPPQAAWARPLAFQGGHWPHPPNQAGGWGPEMGAMPPAPMFGYEQGILNGISNPGQQQRRGA